MDRASRLRDRAQQIADEVLFPAAPAVDRAAQVPAAHLDLLAREGFYGLGTVNPDTVNPDTTGPDTAVDFATLAGIVQALASGCLSTTFVWVQHLSALFAVADAADDALRDRWHGPLARGERRAGVAFAGLRPGNAPLRLRASGDRFVLDGTVPWVTGWGMIDTLYLGARDADDVAHFVLLDTAPSDTAPTDTLTVAPLDLVAVQASATVDLTLTGYQVGADRLVATRPYADWQHGEANGAALNGFLALGVAERCARLLGEGESALERDIANAHNALLAAEGAGVVAARAAASQLALRAAAALAVHEGSRAALASGPAQRFGREALFLLVFGSRPAIREALLNRLLALP